MRPLALFAILAAIVLITWGATGWLLYPLKEDRGTIGDMFGVASSLFSGLALAGLVVNIFQQQRQIELPAHENRLAAEANDRAARLTALSALIVEYTALTERKQEELLRYGKIIPRMPETVDMLKTVHEELLALQERRLKVFVELERVAGLSGDA